MGDMAEMYADMRAEKQSFRQQAMVDFELWRERLEGLGLKKQNEFHYTFNIQGETGGWWPSTQRWHFGKTYHGTAEQFHRWLDRRVARLMK